MKNTLYKIVFLDTGDRLSSKRKQIDGGMTSAHVECKHSARRKLMQTGNQREKALQSELETG